MFINKIDELFDTVIDNFYDFLYKKNFFKKIKDINFVVYQEQILLNIKEFIKTIDINVILKYVKKEHLDYIINIIKRYCAFYIYLGISYYYQGNRELFITNIIEISKNQKETIIKIDNFFNSTNNSKIIYFFTNIQNIKYLVEFKTFDKIKIIMSNNLIRFENIQKLFEELGEEYINNFILIKDNFHYILKTIIFKEIYIKEEKLEINNLLNEIEKEKSEYKYIEIVVSKTSKLVDFNIIQKFLNYKQTTSGLANEIYKYLEENEDLKKLTIKENKDIINHLFSNKILIPITEEFLRYHKDIEKYDNYDTDNKSKFVLNKINNTTNYYSSIVKNNPKLKLEVENYFYKNLDPKMAVLYNDNEEIKVIQRLSLSDNPIDKELLFELENFRKYSYINFKTSLQPYIKLRPYNSIESVRTINLKKKKKEYIDMRIGNENIDINIIGVILNPKFDITKKYNLLSLDCYKRENLIHVNGENGFLSFIKILSKKRDITKLYYWLFNNNADVPLLNKYIDYNKNDFEKNYKNMLYEIYDIWLEYIKNKLVKYIKNNYYNIEYLLHFCYQKYFMYDIKRQNEINKIYQNHIYKEYPIIEDITDNIIPGKSNKVIKLPILKIKKEEEITIYINENKKIFDIEENNKNAICNHYYKWNAVKHTSQNIFEFVKKYIKENDNGQYVCKSCNELINIDKYVHSGTYDSTNNVFMTTSLVVKENLEKLPKYSNLHKTIDNLNKLLEKIAYISNITYYSGNDSTTRLNRKLIIKDTIDLILLHTLYLKEQPKTRIEKACENYNITKDYTNLFFFELKNEIFITSTTDTDYYKKIKYNNVLVYLVFIIITELNSGQILNLKNDKICNMFIHSKIGNVLFKDMYLRRNDKDKILITNIPLLSYIIYYFSCIITNNRIWLSDYEDKKFNINVQKSFIHTFVDLLNSISEANFQKDKNYLYEILFYRFNFKLTHVFNDKKLVNRINELTDKKIIYDENTKKASYVTKNISYISIENNINQIIHIPYYCNVKTYYMSKIKYIPDNNNITSLTNCLDGKFHSWIIKNNTMICSLCNYNNNQKEIKDYYKILKISILKLLIKKYCLNGTYHMFCSNNVCTLCNINPESYKYTENDLFKLDKLLEKKENDIIFNNYKLEKIKKEEKIIDKEKNKNTILKFKNEFKNDNDIEKSINKFIDRLINILGNKIKIKNKILYLKDTLYIIDHDYLGNPKKDILNILSSNNLILIYNNHPEFNKDVLYYKDNSNKVYVYYDIITLQYLGYSDNNKNIKKNKNKASIKIEYSIKDSLLILGLENKYTNLYHYDSNLINNFNPNVKYIINNLLRTRTSNLKQIINRIKSIIYLINNHGKYNNIYNIKEKEIINEFSSSLKKFNCNDIFTDSLNICKLVNFKPITDNINLEFNKNYMNNNFLNKLNNSDIKLIYYIINNFNKLLDNNKQPAIESQIAYLIITLIKFSLNIYLIENNIYELRKFEYVILANDDKYKDENVRYFDLYEELVTTDEINEEEIKEKNYDAKEAFDSLDIDEYDADDDIDQSAEVLDGGYEE